MGWGEMRVRLGWAKAKGRRKGWAPRQAAEGALGNPSAAAGCGPGVLTGLGGAELGGCWLGLALVHSLSKHHVGPCLFQVLCQALGCTVNKTDGALLEHILA